jgi:hypothetical protein
MPTMTSPNSPHVTPIPVRRALRVLGINGTDTLVFVVDILGAA